MNTVKTHQNLTDEYFSICKLRKKLAIAGALIQFSLITLLFCWKLAEMGQYKIAAPILLSLSIFYFLRSISEFRRIEGRKSQTIIEGLVIEKQNKIEKKLFHKVLEKFNLKQTLFTRFASDLISLGIIGYFIYQLLLEIVPGFSIPCELLIPLYAGGLSTFACKEYYEAVKPLSGEKKKSEINCLKPLLEGLSDSENHKAQAIEYKKLFALFKKNGLIGIIEMFATLLPLHFISNAEAPNAKLMGIFLAVLAVFFMGNDYRRLKNLDKKVTKLVLNGIELEKKNPHFDRFFYNILDEFSIVRILVSRSLCTVLCVYFLCNSINKIFFGKTACGEHKIMLSLLGSFIGIIVCIFYYSSYKKFDELKK